MTVLGIDPGTSRWGFVFMEGGEIKKETAIETSKIRKKPGTVLDLALKADLVVAPSGYGLPIKKVSELNERDFHELLLKRKNEKTVMSLESVLRSFKENNVPAYVIPGVKHLKSVPVFRKVNKMDMGTPDKLCATVFGIENQAKRLDLEYGGAFFVLCELGSAFNAFIAVEGGLIVDGIGGTIASSGSKGHGALDGELCYLMGGIGKEELYKGGMDYLEEDIALAYFFDGVLKDINRIMMSTKPVEIVVSGQKGNEVFDYIRTIIKDVIPVVQLGNDTKASSASIGAAMIASALAGEAYVDLIKHMGLREAGGSIFDYTKLKEWGSRLPGE
ncbi:MAG: DUF1464 family protein [Candidatus Altiarchaeota archaeon]|nr:DUF1464 family protein [Candidatus Altiarchaeota archaeon]